MSSPPRPDWSGRLRQLEHERARQSLDGLIVSSSVNVKYLTGFTGTSGWLVIASNGVVLLTDGRYTQAVRQELARGTMAAVELVTLEGRADRGLVDVLVQRGLRRVGFEAEHTTVATLDKWRQAADRAACEIGWIAQTGTVEAVRLIKGADEIEILRRGGRAIAGVARDLRALVVPGMTEREVADRIDRALKQAGFAALAFPTIVASGPQSALPHARPTDRQLGSGDLVLLDFGGVLDGYCVDLTRMAVVGQASPAALELFDAVTAAHAAALEVVAPGRLASDVDDAARSTLAARGLGEAFLHATGHGLGVEVHEAPRVGKPDPDAPTRLAVGMVFTIEPGAYLAGVGGVRLEDDVLVTREGSEVLTDAPRALLVI